MIGLQSPVHLGLVHNRPGVVSKPGCLLVVNVVIEGSESRSSTGTRTRPTLSCILVITKQLVLCPHEIVELYIRCTIPHGPKVARQVPQTNVARRGMCNAGTIPRFGCEFHESGEAASMIGRHQISQLCILGKSLGVETLHEENE